jgi:hypothetical protein
VIGGGALAGSTAGAGVEVRRPRPSAPRGDER